jgi:ubiquitin-like-conjugating enzyme ATG10
MLGPSGGAIHYTIEYDILLSLSYRVPVMYFCIQDQSSRPVMDVDAMYDLIVTTAYHSQLKDAGVIGGISTTDHPVDGRPVWFIHPCQTAEALEKAAGHGQVQVEVYLQLWLGIIGAPVGLHAPLPSDANVPSPGTRQ